MDDRMPASFSHFSIASILMLDGVTNGAVYALLALATVLVFAVTRVIFIPQGEFVAYGALTLALLQLGQVPGTVWLLLVMALLAAVLDAMAWERRRGQPVARCRALRCRPCAEGARLPGGGLSPARLVWAAPQPAAAAGCRAC